MEALQETVLVSLDAADSILEVIEDMYDQITGRAYEIFRSRGGVCAIDVEDWLIAEKEMIWKPEVDVAQLGDHLVLTFTIGENPPPELSVLATPTDVLLQGPASAGTRRVFRVLHTPQTIAAHNIRVRYTHGRLILVAPIVEAA